ncbi:PilZ domain-containing protein [bacterium]|nr:PilZ domain-containing protein [bacterium]
MLLESLKALILAGKETLQQDCNLPVRGAAVSQVHQGRLSFPALAEIQIRSGTLQTVYLGCDKDLKDHLVAVGGAKLKESVESLAKTFLSQLLAEMEGRHPRGRVAMVHVSNAGVTTRGVRSFGIRLATGKGQLFLLAEVPSKVELELAKGTDYLSGMISTYLPADWMNREVVTNRALVDSTLKLMHKIESDVYLEVPRGEDEAAIHAGTILERSLVEGAPVLKIGVDLSRESGTLAPGAAIHATAGLEDRSLDFEVIYLGPATHSLTAGVSMHAALFSVPESLAIAQRRKAFRIPVPTAVSVEIAPVDEDVPALEAFQRAAEERVGYGRLADLSFSGARIVLDLERSQAAFKEGQRVVCRLVFPDEFEPMDVMGIVRRQSKTLANRNEWQDEVGLEFLVSPDLDRRALDYVRQFVLTEQRAKLAQRMVLGKR